MMSTILEDRKSIWRRFRKKTTCIRWM